MTKEELDEQFEQFLKEVSAYVKTFEALDFAWSKRSFCNQNWFKEQKYRSPLKAGAEKHAC